MLTGIFDNLVFWHWWVFAIILLVLEIFSPGAFFMWLSAAAGILGIVLYISPDLSWQVQFSIFALTSITTIIAGKIWFSRNPIKTEMPSLNTREDELIGKTFEVIQAIENGSGRVKVGESTWKANGPDCKEGSIVRVAGVNGAELSVEPI